MPPKRRSGRIAKELPIVLLGTDTAGKVFAEETKTVVLSRHGAGVVSRYRFAPDEILTLRLVGSPKEAEVRLVGQIGGEPGRYIHGLAFVDSDLDFWPMKFPPPEPFGAAQPQLTLECTSCHTQQGVAHGEIEEDVYAVNGNVLRFCHSCGTSTPWIKARAEAMPTQPGDAVQPRPATAVSPDPFRVPRPASSNGHALSSNVVPAGTSSLAPARDGQSASKAIDPTRASLPQSAGTSMPSGAYSGAALETIPTAAAELPTLAVNHRRDVASDSSATASSEQLPRPTDPQGRPVNRRKHMRVRVNFSACVKEPLGATDIVECANMSKGGLCFHSRKRYPVGSTIEIAAPFSPGAPAIFVTARIKRVEPVGDGPLFRYGVAYVESKT